MDLAKQLQMLIQIPSLSGEEHVAADWIQLQMKQKGIPSERLQNNVWAKNLHFDESKPTVLLNSHLDTVKATGNWEVDPLSGNIVGEKIIGLGANDAGASLICLLHTFIDFYEKTLPFNLIFCASAEEENSGKNGMELVRNSLGEIDFAIVGEPTNCEFAVAEKGLLVIDALVSGEAGHAARNSGKNAIYMALEDIQKLNKLEFSKVSETLGKVHLNVTQINAGTQHNVIPESCAYVIDVRLTDCYTHEEILTLLQEQCSAVLLARSTRLKPSGLTKDHVIFNVAEKLNIHCYGSPTMSDQALMPWPSIKTGPGFSERSHTINEYILLSELEQGKTHYTNLLNALQDETLG